MVIYNIFIIKKGKIIFSKCYFNLVFRGKKIFYLIFLINYRENEGLRFYFIK